MSQCFKVGSKPASWLPVLLERILLLNAEEVVDEMVIEGQENLSLCLGACMCCKRCLFPVDSLLSCASGQAQLVHFVGLYLWIRQPLLLISLCPCLLAWQHANKKACLEGQKLHSQFGLAGSWRLQDWQRFRIDGMGVPFHVLVGIQNVLLKSFVVLAVECLSKVALHIFQACWRGDQQLIASRFVQDQVEQLKKLEQ